MNFEETLAASQRFQGPLGAVAFVVVHGLELGGVDALTVGGVLDALRKGLKGLSDAQCEVLVQVLEARLAEARVQGPLHEKVRLRGELTTVEAHIARDVLSQGGVKAWLNHAHGPDPFPDNMTDVEIWVRRRDVEKAEALLAAPVDAGQPVLCPSCNEENPGHFGACWKCGASLAGAAPKAS